VNVVDAILARVSCPRLVAPGPDAGQLQCLLDCALRAPDHGLLRPWRYLVFQGDARHALGRMFVAAAGEADERAREKLAMAPLRAPLVIACVARIVEGNPRVPPVEQVASVAAGIQNMQLAAEAMGYGAMWRSGDIARNGRLKALLGLEARDEIVGFLYVGTPAGDRPARPAPAAADHVRIWPADDAG
jgi:nitroreductase